MFGATQLAARMGAHPRPADADVTAWTAYARSLARLGLPVLFVNPGTKLPADWRSDAEKKKAGDEKGGVHLATTHIPTLKKYLERAYAETPKRGHPSPLAEGAQLNWAVRLGGSGYIVADADTPEEVAALRAFLAPAYGGQQWVPSPTVKTPGTADGAHSDGGHWWFKLPDTLDFDLESLPSVVKVTVDGHAAGFTLYVGDAYVLVPPSVRAEGAYRLVSSDTEAPAEVLEVLATHATVAAERQERRAEQAHRALSGDVDPLEDQVTNWSQATPWSEVLAPHGWHETGSVDQCGCPVWTAPGEHSSPKSATTHDMGCDRPQVDQTNPPIHLWTDNPGDELAEVVTRTGSKTMSKLTAYAALEHDGDISAAMHAAGIERDHSATMLDPADILPGATTAGAPDTASPEPVDPELAGLDKDTRLWVQRHDAEERGRAHVARRKAAERAAEVGDVPIYIGADALAVPVPENRWRVDHVISSGAQVLFYAREKTGKSKFVHNLAACLTSGRRFLDRYDIAPMRPDGRVVLVDTELEGWELSERLRRWHGDIDGSHLGMIALKNHAQGFNPMDDVSRAYWTHVLRDMNAEVVVFDTLGPLIRRNGLDDNVDSGTFMLALRDMCHDAGVDVHVVVDHESAKSSNPGNGPKGDSGKTAFASHVWYLAAEDNDGEEPTSYRFTTSGRAPDVSLELTRDGGHFTTMGAQIVKPDKCVEDAHLVYPTILELLEDAHAELCGDDPDSDDRTNWPSRHKLISDAQPRARRLKIGRDRLRAAVDHLVAVGSLEQIHTTRTQTLIRPTGSAPQPVGTYTVLPVLPAVPDADDGVAEDGTVVEFRPPNHRVPF